ncbi:MAG: hypothetical protein AAF752_03430, partial [Bacteroidota bacterium]
MADRTAHRSTSSVTGEVAGDGGPVRPGGGQPAPARRGLGRRLLRWAGYAVLGVVLLLGVAVLALNTSWGGEHVRGLAVDAVNAAMTEGEFSMAGLDIDGIRTVEATGLLFTHKGDTAAYVPRARTTVGLLPLLTQTVDVRALETVEPFVAARQGADSVWNWVAMFAPDPDAPVDTTAGWTIKLDDTAIDDARIRVAFYNAERDSAAVLRNLTLRLSDAVLAGPETLRGEIERLSVAVVSPFTEAPLDVELAGRFEDLVAEIDTLSALSPRSRLTASGLVAPPTPELAERIDFRLDAEPFHFGDIAGLVPSLNPEATVAGSVRLDGRGSDVLVRSDLRTGAGGQFDLEALVTPRTDGPVRYTAEGELVAFDPAYITGNEQMAGTFNARLDADLSGTQLDRLEGRAGLRIFDSEWRGEPLPTNAANIDFADGRGQFEVDAGLYDARVDVAGMIAPFEAVPAYRAEGTFTGIELAQFIPESDLNAGFSGRFNVNGNGFAPESAVARAAVELREGYYNDLRFQDTRAGVTVRNGQLDFSVGSALRGAQTGRAGSVDLSGSLNFAGEVLRYSIDEGQFNGIDVAAITGTPDQSSDLSGTLSLTGTGTDPAAMGLDLQATLTESEYGAYRLDAVNLAASMAGGITEFDVDAQTNAGILRASGTARPFAEVITYDITSGSFVDLDIGVLTENAEQSSDLDGSFTASGQGIDPQVLSAQARVDLRPSVVNEQRITDGTATVRLAGGELDVQADLVFPEGEVELAATGQPFAERPRFNVSEGRFDRLDIGAILGNEQLRTNLSGRFNVDLDGTSFDDQTTLDARLDLAGSTVNGEQIQSGTLNAALAQGRLQADLQANLTDGELVLQTDARPFDDMPVYEAGGRFRNVDFAALAGIDTVASRLNGGFTLDGRGLNVEAADLSAMIALEASIVDQVNVDTLLAEVRLAQGVLQVDTLKIASNFVDATGSGPVALREGAGTSAFEARVNIESLEPVRKFAGIPDLRGEGTARVTVRGPGGNARFVARPDLSYLTYNNIRIAWLSGIVAGSYRDSTLQVETNLDVGYTAMPGFTFEESQVEFSYGPSGGRADVSLRVDGRR